MKRKKQNLDGLSLPINSFTVVLQLLSIVGLMTSFLPCLHFMANPLLWSSVAVFGISTALLVMFKGLPLLVFYSRFMIGFLLVCIALVQAASLDQFELFIRSVSDDIRISSNPLTFLNSNATAFSIILIVIEFVIGIALIIGAWIRFVSIAGLIVLCIYALAFWNLTHLQMMTIDESAKETLWNFKLDPYLAHELSNQFCFVFACAMSYLLAMGIAFGPRIYPNSVKLNWYLLPILSGLAALFSVLIHWYTPLFLIPLTLMSCLLIYRSGGRFFANHFGALVVALGFIVCFIEFQYLLGIEMKPRKEINRKGSGNTDHSGLKKYKK